MPFVPDKKQLIFVENGFHVDFHESIQQQMDEIIRHIPYGYEFCYIPHIVEELILSGTIDYFIPYQQPADETKSPIDSSSLLKYLVDSTQRETIDTGLLCFQSSRNNAWMFRFYPLQLQNITGQVLDVVEQEHNATVPAVSYSVNTDADLVSVVKNNSIDDTMYSSREESDAFQNEINRVVAEVAERIKFLRAHGVHQMVLESLVSPEIKLSRILITPDYRIYLPDYQNIEIEMTPLVKTVYFLFLLHPGGIRFKELYLFSNELKAIYKQVRGIKRLTPKMEKSISDLIQPYNNSINEKCARIHQVFIQKFDDRLARHYYIHGEWGEAKRISISRDMVEWK